MNRLPKLIATLASVLTVNAAQFTGRILTEPLEVPGRTNVSAVAIANSGSILGYTADPDGSNLRGFTVTGTQVVALPIPAGSTDLQPWGFNTAGMIVGELDYTRGFVLMGTNFTLVDFPAEGVTETLLTGINEAGLITGTAFGDTGPFGFTLQDTNFARVSLPGASRSFAYDVNNRGVLVGQYRQGAGDTFGFWKRGTNAHVALQVPGADRTIAYGINDNDVIVGAYRRTNETTFHGFIYEAGIYTQFDVPGSSWTVPSDLNDDGVIVGYYQDSAGDTHPFRATRPLAKVRYRAMTLDVPGKPHTLAFGLNDRGEIVGQWYGANFATSGGFRRGLDNRFALFPPPAGYDGIAPQAVNMAGSIVGQAYPDGFVLRQGINVPVTFPEHSEVYLRAINNSGVFGGNAVGDFGDVPVIARDGINLALLPLPAYVAAGVVTITDEGIVGGYRLQEAAVDGTVNNFTSGYTLDGANTDTIRVPGSYYTSVDNLSSRGEVFGSFLARTTGNTSRSYVLQEEVFTEVELVMDHPEARGPSISGRNESGTLVGYYTLPDGSYHGFVAYREDARLTDVHSDIGFDFALADGWNPHVHNHGTDTEFKPWEAVLVVNPQARVSVPANPAFSFLGAAGAPVWILPQFPQDGLLYLGVGAESIEPGTFQNDQFRLELKGVEGPGDFSLYLVDGFGKPTAFLNSGDGISSADVYPVIAGSHVHMNWGFTRPGTYTVTLQATGILADGTLTTPGPRTYTFLVLEAPTQLALVPWGQPSNVGGPLNGVSSVSPADLDGDGKPDILAGAYGAGHVSWLKNLGSGSFGNEQIIDSVAEGVWFTKAGDLDGDGDQDVLAGLYSGSLNWYRNDGSGAFLKQVLDTNSVGAWLEIGDLDGDGRTDVLAGPDGGTNVWWYRGLSGGTFAAGTNLVTGLGGLGGIVVRDIDGDGDQDLMLGDYRSDELVWYLNQGGGVLGTKQMVAGGDGSGLVDLRDLDGDGRADLISLEYNAEKVSWFKNLGGGAFGPRQAMPFNLSGPYAVTVADFDGDGDLDVAVATYSSAPDFAWAANQGNGMFSEPLLISRSMGQVSMLASSDFDADGDVDIAVGSFSSGQVFLFDNQRGEKATSVVPPADGRYLLGQNLDTTVHFGFPVTVVGKPQIDLQIGTNVVAATYYSGSGTPSLTFRHTVAEADSDTNGVALLSEAVRPNGGGIFDPFGGPASLDITPATWSPVLVSGSAPFVVSIQRAGATPTDAGEILFTVTFNEPVAGFGSTDVNATPSSGLTGASVTGVSGSGAQYQVSVGTGAGSGTLGLGILAGASITDTNGVPLGAAFGGGEVFTLLRGPMHTITNFYPSGHGDIAVGYDTRGWNVSIDSDDHGRFAVRDALIYGGPDGRTVRSSGPLFDFLGVSAGQPLYVWAENGTIPTLPELGVGGEGVPGGTVAAYFNSDPRVNASGPWVNVRLAAVRGPEGAHLSVYTMTQFGTPVVWWATSDGVTANDTVTILEGSHQHFNFAFTQPGIYEADIIVSGYRDANGNGVYDAGADPYIESGVETLYFAIDLSFGMQSYTIPAGMSGRRPLPAFVFETFDIPGATDTLVSDIRNDGTLVGRFHDGNGLSQGFIQSGTNRTVFNVTGNTATFPGGIDNFGRIAGFYRDATNPEIQHGFIRQTNGTFTTIDGPGQNYTYAWRINDAGQVNGYWFEDPFFIPSFRREANGVFATNTFPGSPLGTVARGMNDAGDLAGWKWDENYALQGVVFGANGSTNVFTIPGWDNTLPGDINNLGDVAGTVNINFEQTAGFFRRANGQVETFVPPGAVSSVEVFGMNDLGVIVGEYTDATGSHGFIARPVPSLQQGHTDVGIAFENGEFDLHIHDEENDVEYAPDQAVLTVLSAAEQAIPDTASYAFLGEPGRSKWILAQSEDPNQLFLGLGAEEIASGIFVGNRLQVDLVSLNGPGDFALFALDPFGNPIVYLNSADGISAADTLSIPTGGHAHYNWAFSASGTYVVGLRVRGTLVAGNAPVLGTAYYTFTVPSALLPQPPAPDTFVYNVVDIGTFGGTAFANALGINNAGVVVGGANFADNTTFHPYRFSGNGPKEDLGTAGGDIAGANDINEAGEITGTTFLVAGADAPYLPFRYTTNGVMQVITNSLGGLNGEAAAINEAGRIVGAADLALGQFETVAFYADADNVMHSLGTFGGTESRAENINDAGYIVGNARLTNGERRAFRHLGNGPLNPTTDDLGTLGGNRSQAHAINAAGKVTGTSRLAGNGSSPAFLWEAGVGMTNLGTLGSGTLAYGFGINTNDVVVGWSTTVGLDFDTIEAFIWDREHGMRNLNDLVPRGLGLRIDGAYAINDEGWIAGTATRLSDGAATPILLKPATRLLRGHTDIGLAYEDDLLLFEVHSDDLGQHFDGGAAILNVPARAVGTVPNNPAYAFLGSPGAPVWILPQTGNPQLLFLGLASEEIANGIFTNDEVEIALKSVAGPGHFSVYGVDGFGQPNRLFDTSDGINASDVATLGTGGHNHINWAFTQPGYYRVTLEGTGVLQSGGSTLTTRADFFFEVISATPEASIRLETDGGLTIRFVTEEGVLYQLQTRAQLGAGAWENAGQPFIGTGREKQLSVPAGEAASYFRLTTGN